MTDQPTGHPDDPSGQSVPPAVPPPGRMPPPADLPAAPPIEGSLGQHGSSGPVEPMGAPRPGTVVLAMRLMWAGAAVAVLQGILGLFMRDSVRTTIVNAAERGNQTLTSSQIDTLVTVGVVVQFVEGLLIAGLWMLVAWANGRGAAWARIVASVLFGLNTLFFVAGLAGAQPVVSRVIAAVTFIIGAAAIVMLWQRESSAFYADNSRRRRP